MARTRERQQRDLEHLRQALTLSSLECGFAGRRVPRGTLECCRAFPFCCARGCITSHAQQDACCACRVDVYRLEINFVTGMLGPTNRLQTRIEQKLAEVEQRLARQVAAIEAGVDPMIVGERIRELKHERGHIEAALNDLVAPASKQPIPVDDAREILGGLPNLQSALASADPELRRQVYEAFRLRVEIDRNEGLITLKALVSSAFADATDLDDVVANGTIAGERSGPNSKPVVPIESVVDSAL